jgi:hypothetical protein
MRPTHRSTATEALAVALAGGFAAILGGAVFAGAMVATSPAWLHTTAAVSGSPSPLGLVAGIIGCFGLMGFTVAPMLRAPAKQSRGPGERR